MRDAVIVRVDVPVELAALRRVVAARVDVGLAGDDALEYWANAPREEVLAAWDRLVAGRG